MSDPRTEEAVLEPALDEPEAVVEAEIEAALGGLDVDAPRVGLIGASDDDLAALAPAEAVLADADVLSERRVLPERDELTAYAANAHMRGLQVLVVGSAGEPATASVAAAQTDLPVIGVPLGDEGLEPLLHAASDAPVAVVREAAAAGHLALRVLRA